MQHHSSWDLLFHNPDFWDLLSKHHLCHLRSTCKEFHARIPEREAVLRVFRNAWMRKADLFRLLPLTVYDVLKLRSPVRLTDALRIAERRTKGFEACIAIVRDKGGRLCSERSQHRAERLHDIEDALLQQSNGAAAAFLQPPTHPVLERAVTSASNIARVVYWHLEFDGPVSFPRSYKRILNTIQQAHGYWYKGIHGDTLAATRAVFDAAQAAKPHCVHFAFAHNTLTMGVVRFGGGAGIV